MRRSTARNTRVGFKLGNEELRDTVDDAMDAACKQDGTFDASLPRSMS